MKRSRWRIAGSFGRVLPLVVAPVLGLIAVLVLIPTLAAIRAQSGSGPGSGDASSTAGKEWPLVGGDRGVTHYSTLSQINAQNVKSLGGAWMSKQFLDGATSRTTPGVRGDSMFVTAGKRIYALNATTGEILWTKSGISTLNHGLTTAEGKVFVGLQDGRMAALDQKTGEQGWSQQLGGAVTAPPAYSGGVLYVGVIGARGRVAAVDAETGKELWGFDVVPGPGELGHDTWPQNHELWTRGGGGVWQPGAIDPDLGLVYFCTGNADPLGGDARPGNNLFTASVIALDIKTGKLRWYYQTIHHDIWEADMGPLMLYDTKVDGRPRKAIAVMRADGYLFLLDRETGKPVLPVEERQVPQDAIQKTSPTQPFPIRGESVLPDCSTWKGKIPDGFVLGCPYSPPSVATPNLLAQWFTMRITPMSYSPQTGYFYAEGMAGLSWRRRSDDPMFLGVKGNVPGIDSFRVLAAIDSRTGKIAWKKETPAWLHGQDLTSGYTGFKGGSLATAGGLLFHLENDGNFTAYDANSGGVLWQFQTGFPGGGGPPSTFEIAGEQYVAVSAGPVVWAFKLGGTAQPLPVPKLPSVGEDGFFGLIQDTDRIETATLRRSANATYGQRYFVDEYSFNPYRARVKVGTRVSWVNSGRSDRTIIAKDGSWTTGRISAGSTGFVTFDKPGEYTYITKEDPWSYGQIIVTSASDDMGGSSTAQALRGRDEFETNCASCHGEDLTGGFDGEPPLIGDTFLVHWQGRSVSALLGFINSAMPRTNPGSLSRQAYLDIAAFLLRANNISVGADELKDGGAALEKLKISATK